MDVSHLLNALNAPQREAVSAPACHQLVLAGAGSGKTRVLVHRIAWLIQVMGVPPHRILAVTFTNKAAKEMRERLETALGHGSQPRHLWVGTFHAIAHRLLKTHWQDAQLPQDFHILDSDDQLRLIKRVYQNLNLDEERYPPKNAQWFINEQKDEGHRAAQLPDGPDPFSRAMKALYTGYEAACQQGGLVDFAELLLRSFELFQQKPALLEHYQQRFAHILVDEFQDTNAVQMAWLRLLAGQNAFVTAVGDDDQSIYGWRGARIENIQHFPQHFANTQTTRLEQNYRSNARILEAANAVISHNTGRLGKHLWTDNTAEEPIDLYAAFNEQDEARFVVDRIQRWVQQGQPRASVAILYRSNAQSRVLEEALLREGVPYRIYGGQRFYERLEIKNALAYLRLLLNRDNDAAFDRALNTPTRGIGSRTEDTLRLTARDQHCSLHQAALHLLRHNSLPARAATALRGFLQLLDQLHTASQGLSLPNIVGHVIQASGLLQFHQTEKGERGQARVENLQELVNASGAFACDDTDIPPLAQFLDSAALDAGDTQASSHEDAVQLMTLHSAKGLEFPLVFLVGLEENLFPHKMSSDTHAGLEEERRLCYVGITRAMHKLVLCHAESRRLYGIDQHNRASRFIKEIPSHCLQELRPKAHISRPLYQSRPIPPSPSATPGGFTLGQSVRHTTFGEGVITQFEGQANNARVQVNFGKQGTKWLVLAYARLEPA